MTRPLPTLGPGPLSAPLLATALQAFALLAGPLLALAPSAPAQTLLDATGATAIQGTLNSTATPSYGNTLQQVKASLGRTQGQGSQAAGFSSFGGSSSGGSPAAGQPGAAAAGSAQAAAGTSAPGGSAGAGPGTYVNGRYVAICSHGGLCLGQLQRALRRP